LEFLLINHPLDCPICDQAGECELQNYVFREGRSQTRYTPRFSKRFDPVEDFGPDILYVANRCILCTRCVRFMDHVAEEAVISVSERGDRAFIGIHPERQLDHPWAGNVVDLCPVGSLISKDFLHKARAWEVDMTPSICTGCSQGCNVTIDTRSNAVVRLKPRVNMEVNRFFMCDQGRHSYRWMNKGDRIEVPLVKDNGGLVATDWEHALQRAAQAISGSGGRAVALVSAGASNEALFLTKQLFAGMELKSAFRVNKVDGEEPLPGVEGLALRAERAPNATGARCLGYSEEFDDALSAVDGAAVVFVLDEALDGVSMEHLGKAAQVIYVGTSLPECARGADVVLPVANAAEEDGSFTNRDSRVQRYAQAKTPPGMARPAWWVLGEIRAQLGDTEPFTGASQAFDALSESVSVFAGLSFDELGYEGRVAAQPSGAGVSP
ncbi:MAG: molybdopterin-dependent oxidoreductase, partial [Gemmatimonadota bacterium]